MKQLIKIYNKAFDIIFKALQRKISFSKGIELLHKLAKEGRKILCGWKPFTMTLTTMRTFGKRRYEYFYRIRNTVLDRVARYCQMRKHLYTRAAECRFCGNEVETSIQILSNCNA